MEQIFGLFCAGLSMYHNSGPNLEMEPTNEETKHVRTRRLKRVVALFARVGNLLTRIQTCALCGESDA